MSILEELWYGNVNPGELNIKKHSPCKELLALMIRHQDDLLARLNDEEKEIFGLYPHIIGYLDGGKVGDDYIASKLTLSPDGFNIKAVSYTGNPIFDENFEW